MYLLDTDIVIWALRGKQEYVDLIQNLKYKATLSISNITVAEVYKNVYPSEVIKTEEVLREFYKWDITFNIAKQAGSYWGQYSKKFRNLHIFDCIIAATAFDSGLTLLTLNIRHFPMDDIKARDPLKLK